MRLPFKKLFGNHFKRPRDWLLTDEPPIYLSSNDRTNRLNISFSV